SGSGVVNRVDMTLLNAGRSANGAVDLAALARAQTHLVLHALSFPRVRRVVYSTCSVHREENEDVVAAVLASGDVARRFRVAHVLPQWPRRGLGDADWASACVRTDPAHDETIGFFVACFERRTDGDG